MAVGSQGITCCYVFDSEQPNPPVAVNRPFLCLHVRLAAVVGESSEVAFGACVYDPNKIVSDCWLTCCRLSNHSQ